MRPWAQNLEPTTQSNIVRFQEYNEIRVSHFMHPVIHQMNASIKQGPVKEYLDSSSQSWIV